MSNLDLIDAYFGNEMTEVEKQEFESMLQKDPGLKKEFGFQKEIVDAVKEARRVELKSMLDQVPISGGGTGSAISFGKVATGIAVVVAVGLGAYLLWPEPAAETEDPADEIALVEPEDTETKESEKPVKEEVSEVDVTENIEEIGEEKPAKNTTEETVEQEPEVIKEKEIPVRPEINKPDIMHPFDNQEDISDSLEAPGGDLSSKSYENHDALEVEIDNTNKNFTFHYQFKSGKLFLYGSFDKGLYEILEINSQGRKALFLYYKGTYYTLKANQAKAVPLEPVKKISLIERLERAREGS